MPISSSYDTLMVVHLPAGQSARCRADVTRKSPVLALVFPGSVFRGGMVEVGQVTDRH